MIFNPRLFDCCNPSSYGEPEFLDGPCISVRDPSHLISSASGSLQLYYNTWEAASRLNCHALVFIAHGELDHSIWYNGLANRLRQVGCTVVCHDTQGFGQSDGVRGYFESFDDVVNDFAHVVRNKWEDLCPKDCDPVLVLLGFGFGALVAMSALPLLRQDMPMVQPFMVLVSPAVYFTQADKEMSRETGNCGLRTGSCQTFPVLPIHIEEGALPASASSNLESLSNWFPKMAVTNPTDPDIVSRDPQVKERWARDCLANAQGYRARVLQEIQDMQKALLEMLEVDYSHFADVPCLMLHGGQDALYSHQGTHLLHASWCAIAQPDCLPFLKIYGGAFHHLLHEPNKEEVFNDIVRFVSGAQHDKRP